MGISKKKLKQKTKIENAELQNTLRKQAKEANAVKVDADLFTSNTKADDLKNKRQKLKADRFKQIEEATQSKSEDKLIKKYVNKLERMGKDKFKAAKEKTFGSKKALKDAEFGGELENIWGAPGNSTGVVNSKRHD